MRLHERRLIGPLVHPRGRDPIAINAEVQDWIEAQMRELSPGYAGVMLERKTAGKVD